MDKKSQLQYDPNARRTPFGPHPIFLIGVGVVVLPFISGYLNWPIPSWFYWIGLILIVIGGLISILDNSNIGY
jgi:protein-S-isoprenylcysteine O-methyltransferase Ste14